MTSTYRGHRITVERSKSLAGWEMLFWSIFRVSDGYECDSGFSTSADTVRDFHASLKERVDAELADENPWGEDTETLEAPGEREYEEDEWYAAEP